MAGKAKRRPRPATVPTLVAIHESVTPDFGVSERVSLQAMRSGWAQPRHFNDLLDCADLLLIGATHKRDQPVIELAHFSKIALENVGERFERTKRIATSGEEWKALSALVDVSTDFWSRTSGTLYHQSYSALERFREEQQRKAA